MKTRHEFLVHVAAGAAGMSLVASCDQAIMSKSRKGRPNIVIIYVDDLAMGDVGAFGCPDSSTANIDSLARDGIKLTNSYAINAPCRGHAYNVQQCYPPSQANREHGQRTWRNIKDLVQYTLF